MAVGDRVQDGPSRDWGTVEDVLDVPEGRDLLGYRLEPYRRVRVRFDDGTYADRREDEIVRAAEA